jgi:hypothetical protein
MADDVFPNYSFKLLGLKNAEGGLKFFKTDLPAGTVTVSGVKAWDANGKPSPLSGGGHQVTWNAISMTRYIDDNAVLQEWFKEVCEKGATADTKQEPTIACMNNDTQLFMWTLHEAVPTGYSQSAADAHSSELLTETVTLTYTHADMSR